MNIPEKVKIGFKEYKVNKLKNDVIDGNKVCYGNIMFDKGIINIANKYSEDQINCTLIHECIHGIDDIFDIGLSEEQTQKLGKGLYGFIKDNPLIFSNNGFDANYILTGAIDKSHLKVGKFQDLEEDKIDEFNEFHDALRKIDESTLEAINNGNLLRLLKSINAKGN